jgi:hypothetical protein
MSNYTFSVLIRIVILLVESGKALPPKCLGSKCFKHLTNEQGNNHNSLLKLKSCYCLIELRKAGNET